MEEVKALPLRPAGAVGRGVGVPLRHNTADQMDEVKDQSGTQCAQIVCTLVFCIWIPIVFFNAAGNVNESTCESHDLAKWLKINGLVIYLSTPIVAFVTMAGAALGIRCFFKMGQQLQLLSSVASLVMVIWGWTMYNKVTSELCVEDPKDVGGLNPDPVSLLQWMLFVQLAVSLCLCGCACMAACAAVLVAGADEENSSSAGSDAESSA